MGRKQQQRTKGNLQASSSARAAQILQSKNTAAAGGGLKGFTTTETTETNTAIDPLLSAALRKLNKKESITKQKALLEIIDILNEENVEPALYTWSRVYSKISIDNDHKTRELAQQAHGKLAQLAGRNLAPHLNNIIGPWLEGTCDSYPTAALVAHDSLTKCFSDHKLVGALQFCQLSLLKHIKDRLTSTPATLSDLKQTDPFEAEEKYARVIGGTLRTLIRVLVLLKDNNSDKLTSLLHNQIIWKLGRSKNLQVRKHVYKCVSGICEKLIAGKTDTDDIKKTETDCTKTDCTETDCTESVELPEAAVKVISQNMNSCNHETTPAQWKAVSDVLNTCSEVYWEHITEADCKGQILDALKSKALSGGVLEYVCLYLPNITVAYYNHTKQECEERALAWLSSVLGNAIKCLVQCKQGNDKNQIVTLVFQLSTQMWCDATSDTLFSNIGTMISVLSSERLSDSFAEHMYSALATMENMRVAQHVNLLSQIKRNDHEIQNTLIICRVVSTLMCTCENTSLLFYAELAGMCADRLKPTELKYLSLMLQNYDKISAPLYRLLVAEGSDAGDVSDVNQLTLIFVPLFTAAVPSQIDDLCLCTLILLQNLPTHHHKQLVRTFIDVSQYKHNVLHSFLKQHTNLGNEVSSKYQISSIIPVDNITDNFATFAECDNAVATAIINTSATLLAGLPELVDLFKSHISSIVQEPVLLDKWETLLHKIDWNYLLVYEERHPDPAICTTEIIHLLIEKLENSDIAGKWAAILARIFQSVKDQKQGEWVNVCLDKLFGIVNSENYSTLAGNLVVMFAGHADTVLKYISSKNLLTDTIPKTVLVFMDMSERYGIVQQGNTLQTVTNEYAHDHPVITMFLFCQSFLAKCVPLSLSSFSVEEYEEMCKVFYRLLSTEYTLQIHSPALLKHSFIFKSILEQDSEKLYYSVISEFLWQNDMLIVYFVKDLMTLKHTIDWCAVESVASLPTDSLVNLAVNFVYPGFIDIVKLRLDRDTTISKTEKLLALNYLTYKKEELPQEQLVEFLTEECLDQDLSDLCLAGCVFSTFQHIFKSNETSAEDLEFVLCSTATVFQVCFNAFNSNSDNMCYLTYAMLQFKDLYLLLRDTINKSDNPKFGKFREDWEVFFEPGIGDLVLAFQDKLLRTGSGSGTAGALQLLSHVASLAPPASVRTYMLDSVMCDNMTFDMCYEYVMKLYRQQRDVLLPYEVQNALFKLLLHAQDMWDVTQTNPGTQAEEELEFESPPALFLDTLAGVELADNCTQYEHDLVLAIQVWCLLLRHEARAPAEVVREHVDYLRSKNIVFHFLFHLLHFVKLSAKKYEIVPVDGIVKCDRFEQDHLAASCLLSVAAVFPALLRNWWKKLDKENTLSVEKFVTAFISPVLIRSETNLNIEESVHLKIRARPAVREVVATYTMDEVTADLTINIASNHPLSPPSVSCERQVGVPLATWRSWMLQMTSMFHNQNCSIVEGLEHWRKNMDKQFEGLESCMICFSVVQGPKKSLPKPRCKTCKKKFHSACLYKWFSTSAKSTCPMCRSSFQHSSGLRTRLNETAPEE